MRKNIGIQLYMDIVFQSDIDNLSNRDSYSVSYRIHPFFSNNSYLKYHFFLCVMWGFEYWRVIVICI